MTREEIVAQIFANLVASGEYRLGGYMCNVLGNAHMKGIIREEDYELCMLAIQEFILQLRPSHAEYYSLINSALVQVLTLRLMDRKLPAADQLVIRNLNMAIYKDWRNRFDHVLKLDKFLTEICVYTDKGYLL